LIIIILNIGNFINAFSKSGGKNTTFFNTASHLHKILINMLNKRNL
jgi:hypothetical protein